MSIAEDRSELQASTNTFNSLPGTPGSRERATLDALEAHQQSLKDLAAAARASEQSARPSSGSLMRTNAATNASVVMQGGRATITSGATSHGSAVSSPRPGMVTVGGMTTTIEAAKAGGLIPQDYDPSFKAGVAAAPTSNQQQQAPAQEQTDPSNEITVSSAEQAEAIKAATDAISHANSAIGQTAVNAMTEETVVSGELPQHLPAGIGNEQVSAVVAGYTAQANAVLADTGATVDLLTDMLSDNELRAARLAVYRGNDAELRDLGNRAMDRLVKLPNDPATFKALTAGWGNDVQITRSKGGDTLVCAPGWPKALPWSVAVKQRLITP
jgi:hypothetical protein